MQPWFWLPGRQWTAAALGAPTHTHTHTFASSALHCLLHQRAHTFYLYLTSQPRKFHNKRPFCWKLTMRACFVSKLSKQGRQAKKRKKGKTHKHQRRKEGDAPPSPDGGAKRAEREDLKEDLEKRRKETVANKQTNKSRHIVGKQKEKECHLNLPGKREDEESKDGRRPEQQQLN